MTQAMKVFGITGWKNSGKTTLVVNLVQELRRRGFSIATIKHAHHAFDIDQPGKDSYQHRAAGATQVLVASRQRWALMHELETDNEPTLDILIGKLDPVDIVLVEGFKESNHPKLAVIRSNINKEKLPITAQPLVALASDAELKAEDYDCSGPVFNLNAVAAIADFIVDYCKLKPATTKQAL